MIRKLTMWILWIAMLVAASGCDDRVAQVAREAANRQAQQNTVMAELHQEVAVGTRELVAADAQARREMVGLHRDLQLERARLETNWSALASERRQLASERRTDSVLVGLVPLIGGTLLVIALLGFSWYAVGSATTSNGGDHRLEEFLLREILPIGPPLLRGANDSRRLVHPDQLND